MRFFDINIIISIHILTLEKSSAKMWKLLDNFPDFIC